MKYFILIMGFLLNHGFLLNIAHAQDFEQMMEQEQTSFFHPEKPLTSKQQQALTHSKQWIHDQQYPIRENDQVTYQFEAGQADIVCAPLKICMIELEPGEEVLDQGIHISDTRWDPRIVRGHHNKTTIVLKPVQVGLDSNLAVFTDRRTYHLRLISRKNDYMPKVNFNYKHSLSQQIQKYRQGIKSEQKPEQKSEKPKSGMNLSDLDFNYRVSPCKECQFKPLRVYNNKQQTIIQMNKDLQYTKAPALLIQSGHKKIITNYRIKDDQYIVDTVFEKAVLLIGVGLHQEKIYITRTPS